MRPPFDSPFEPPFRAPFEPPFRPPFGPPTGPPFGPPGRSPFGPPGRPPVGPPGRPPTGPPTGPPPAFTPDFAPFRVDPGSLIRCRGRFTYMWLDTGASFWFYPTFIGRRSVAGYRWARFGWVYFGIDVNRITSFYCF